MVLNFKRMFLVIFFLHHFIPPGVGAGSWSQSRSRSCQKRAAPQHWWWDKFNYISSDFCVSTLRKYFYSAAANNSTIKEAVPELNNKELLKSQFDWLGDGEITELVNNNLGIEIQNMETFLR